MNNEEYITKGWEAETLSRDTSKYNAIKHGILKQALTDESDLYQDIFQQLKAEFHTNSTVEEMLVERAAIAHIKLFRVQKAETEYIKSTLNPRKVELQGVGAPIDLADFQTETVINEGYTPKITPDNIERLANVYACYETTIENRLYRALHELERIRRMKAGETL